MKAALALVVRCWNGTSYLDIITYTIASKLVCDEQGRDNVLIEQIKKHHLMTAKNVWKRSNNVTVDDPVSELRRAQVN